jgi:hypothetical protein
VKLEEGRDQDSSEDTKRGKMPTYSVDRDDTLDHAWWNVKYWGKKGWLILLGVVGVIIVIVVVAVVETKKANQYPNYSKLTYSLSENCKFF